MIKKRLIATSNGSIITDSDNTNMSKMKLLDQAEVKNNKCPHCDYEPLSLEKGMKICPNCGAKFKILTQSDEVKLL